mmetsp:Transcript_23517/g.41281  ORF Transcript_23517/g.41281 Transcript_23517/m.41281 type:complete len:164 (-) Transcript_23517:989-1480(-)
MFPSRYRASRTVFWSEHATLNIVTTAFRRVSGLSSFINFSKVSSTKSFLAISGTWSISPLLRFIIANALHCFGTSLLSLCTARQILSNNPTSRSIGHTIRLERRKIGQRGNGIEPRRLGHVQAGAGGGAGGEFETFGLFDLGVVVGVVVHSGEGCDTAAHGTG